MLQALMLVVTATSANPCATFLPVADYTLQTDLERELYRTALCYKREADLNTADVEYWKAAAAVEAPATVTVIETGIPAWVAVVAGVAGFVAGAAGIYFIVR